MTMQWLDQLPGVISEVIQDELASSSKVTPDQNESFAASQNRSYTTLFSYQRRQENKAKLACLASEYQFRFCSQLCLYFHSVPSPATVPKMLIGAYQHHLAMTPADANLGRQYFMNHEYIRKRTEYRCSILLGSIPGCHLYFRSEGDEWWNI